MRRWSCFIICILLMGMLALPAMAAGGTQMTISPSTETAEPGEEITFTVTISGSEPCKSYGLMLEYDENVYELVGGECSVEGAMIGTFLPGKGFAVLYGQETVPEGTLGTFTLKVKENAAGGTAEVSGKPAVKNGSTSLAASVTGTQVSISGSSGGTSVPKETTAPIETTVPKETAEVKPTAPSAGNSGQSAQSPFDEPWQSSTGQSGQSSQPETAPEPEAQETAALEQEQLEAAAAVQASPLVSEAPSESGGSGWLIAAVAAVLVICAGVVAVVLVRKKKEKHS